MGQSAREPRLLPTTAYRHYLARGESVLAIPFGFEGNSMLWQADTDFYFAMPGGYLSSVVPTSAQGRRSRTARRLQAGRPHAGDDHPGNPGVPPTHHIHHIVIQPGYQRAWTAVLSQIAAPPRRVHGILLYTVNRAARTRGTRTTLSS